MKGKKQTRCSESQREHDAQLDDTRNLELELGAQFGVEI